MGKLFKRLFFGVFTVAAMVVTLSAISVSARHKQMRAATLTLTLLTVLLTARIWVKIK